MKDIKGAYMRLSSPALFFNITFGQSVVVINKGVCGDTTEDLLKRLDSDVIEEVPDLVLIMVGTNDMLSSKRMISYNTYANNLDKLLDQIITKNIKVILVSPPTVDSIYLFERHDKNLYKESPNLKLESISIILESIAIRGNIDFIDVNKVFKEKRIPKHNIDTYIKNEHNCGNRDGVHPTAEGYFLISQTIFNYLKAQKWFNKKLRIVCFGDSITYGENVRGEGTSKGSTYPAYLSKMITAYYK